MKMYEDPRMGIAMFHKENIAVTASAEPPTVINPDAPGSSGWGDETGGQALNILNV